MGPTPLSQTHIPALGHRPREPQTPERPLSSRETGVHPADRHGVRAPQLRVLQPPPKVDAAGHLEAPAPGITVENPQRPHRPEGPETE